MTENTRLYVVKNVTDEPITDTWDGQTYTFEPDAEVTVQMGVALHFLERHASALVRIEEKLGLAPEVISVSVALRNPSSEDFSVTWDGRDYTFPAGEPVPVDRSLVRTLVDRARGVTREDGKSHQLEVVEGGASSAEAETPAAKPTRKKRSKKAAETPAA